MKLTTLFLLLVITAISFCSCVPTNNLIYLKGKQQQNPDVNSLKPEIYKLDFTAYRLQPNDILGIRVETIVPSKYDLGTTEASQIGGQQQQGSMVMVNPLLMGYTIADSGYVQVPLVGSLQVAGLTIEEAGGKIKSAVEERFTDVIVKVQLLTFQVSILGEVSRPGQLTIYNHRLTTILDVLVQMGEPSITANRSKIRLMRRKGSSLESYYIDITKDDIITSPLFYVQPGDIIYVEPLKGVKYAQTNAPMLGILASLINFGFLITNFVLLSRRN